jgi:hypothetical protein
MNFLAHDSEEEDDGEKEKIFSLSSISSVA